MANGFVFESVAELVVFGFPAMFLTAATVWILWRIFETIEPNEVKHIRSFLAFVVVIIPYVMLIYGGLTIVIYDRMKIASSGWPFLPLTPSSVVILAAAVVYIGLTMWLWSHWRKLTVR